MPLTPREIARMIDLSCVQASSTLDEMRAAAALAKKHGCAAVFALPAHTPFVAELLAGSPEVMIGGVVGFPDGGATTAGKVAEATELIGMGCRELDMVINIAWLKAGRDEMVVHDVASVVAAAAAVPVKIILECHYLTGDEIVRACRLGMEAGVAFVKTGTGWAPTGATLENVELMKRTVGDRCGIKAAGGVRDLETLVAMHGLGARRFGIGVRTAKAILEG